MAFEEIITNPAVIAGLTFVGRSVYGWLNNSMKDGQIDKFEWAQLGKTILTLGGFSVFAYFGINAVFPGVISPEGTAAMVAFVDVIKSYFKKKK